MSKPPEYIPTTASVATHYAQSRSEHSIAGSVDMVAAGRDFYRWLEGVRADTKLPATTERNSMKYRKKPVSDAVEAVQWIGDEENTRAVIALLGSRFTGQVSIEYSGYGLSPEQTHAHSARFSTIFGPLIVDKNYWVVDTPPVPMSFTNPPATAFVMSPSVFREKYEEATNE